MKQKTLAIAVSVALLTGLASLDAIAGKGSGGSSGSSGGGGMPSMDMGGGGMSKGSGSGGGMKGTSGMDGSGSKGQATDTQSRERHRTGEKEDVGVRTRSADQAQ